MALDISSPAILGFGVFEVHLRARELRKQGKRIKLQEQPFQVLTVLLRHPGEVVTREELRKQIWPQDTFVDFGNSLNTAINKLREALGDSADNPRFIETLPRRGYRFLAPASSDHQRESLCTPTACLSHEQSTLTRPWCITILRKAVGDMPTCLAAQVAGRLQVKPSWFTNRPNASKWYGFHSAY